jgi:hypothetical protein
MTEIINTITCNIILKSISIVSINKIEIIINYSILNINIKIIPNITNTNTPNNTNK